jgi:hypothetical protein
LQTDRDIKPAKIEEASVHIKFYDNDGELITTIQTDAADHWDACEVGHSYLREGTIKNADDFDVVEEFEN